VALRQVTAAIDEGGGGRMGTAFLPATAATAATAATGATAAENRAWMSKEFEEGSVGAGDLMTADEVTYVLELLGVTLPRDQVPEAYLKSTLRVH
jgi:hypothetical protein